MYSLHQFLTRTLASSASLNAKKNSNHILFVRLVRFQFHPFVRLSFRKNPSPARTGHRTGHGLAFSHPWHRAGHPVATGRGKLAPPALSPTRRWGAPQCLGRWVKWRKKTMPTEVLHAMPCHAMAARLAVPNPKNHRNRSPPERVGRSLVNSQDGHVFTTWDWPMKPKHPDKYRTKPRHRCKTKW